MLWANPIKQKAPCCDEQNPKVYVEECIGWNLHKHWVNRDREEETHNTSYSCRKDQ